MSIFKKNNNSVQIQVPEAFELANIIWTLSPSGLRATNLNKEGEYYQRVLTYFKPYLNHPIIQNLDFPADDYAKYYDFRENSICFSFKNGKLVYEGTYYYVTGDDAKTFNSLFKKLLPLVQDFADKSKFESFYEANKKFYSSEIIREEQRMPIKDMWSWLEKKFPNRKYNSYKVVFSPLIESTHSTQQFWTFRNSHWFGETVMFVSGPSIFDREDLSEKQKKGLLSGIVFTEIDHNYINPVSEKYSKQIDTIFSRREIWTSSGGDTKFYDNPMSVFNEYMTHAVFCLYVIENFDEPTAKFLINQREDLMVKVRHYIKFREFNQALINLYKESKNADVPSLLPLILQWCRQNE
jgi:hypothetical protein